MGVALYGCGVMDKQDSTGDLSMGGRRLRRVVAGREFQSSLILGSVRRTDVKLLKITTFSSANCESNSLEITKTSSPNCM